MTQLGSHHRLVRKLQGALGDELCIALDDANVVEKLNPDGRLFIERLGQEVTQEGKMPSSAAELVFDAVAHGLQSEVDADQPIISGELSLSRCSQASSNGRSPTATARSSQSLTWVRADLVTCRMALQRLGPHKKIGVTTAVPGTLPTNRAAFFQRLRREHYRSFITTPFSQAA